MDWSAIFSSIISGLIWIASGFILAILKGVPKIVEDMWSDHRENKKSIKKHKDNIVTQLLFDIPRGKSEKFSYRLDREDDTEQTLANISIYDKKMSKRISEYLKLWRKYVNFKEQFDQLGFVNVYESGDEYNDYEDSKKEGPVYVDNILYQLLEEYDEIIDLLNSWRK